MKTNKKLVKKKKTKKNLKWINGDRAIYINNNNRKNVIILDIHKDDPEDVYYTIQFSDGSQRQTISKYIKKI